MLEHDSSGFLTGTVVPTIKRANEALMNIRSDIKAIKAAMFSQNNQSGSTTRSFGAGSNIRPSVASRQSTVVVIPNSTNRDSSGRFRSSGPGSTQTSVIPGRRDANGRFAGSVNSSESAVQQNGFINNLASRIGSAVSSSTNDLEAVDPTIQAARELSGVVTPLMGIAGIGGSGGDDNQRWYKKIFRELNLFRSSDTVFNRATTRVLRDIDSNTEGGNGSEGSQSFMGGLLGSISPWMMTALTSIGAILSGAIGTVLGGIFTPVGLAIGAASVLAWGLFTESGQKFFGDVGANIIAGWDKVTLAFKPITTSISSSWDSVAGNFNGVIDGMLSSWNAFTGFLKDKFGIDIPAIFKPVVDIGKKVIDGAKSGIDAVGEKASSLGNKANDFIKDKTGFNIKESVSNTASSIKGGINSITDKVTDGATKIASRATGKQSTNKAAMIAEMDSQGITNENERAMLMAQVDHESGGFTYTKELGKDSYFDKYDADTKKGRELGNTEMGDGAKYKGRGFMQLTGKDNYARAGKDLGLDLVNHPELAESPENSAKTAMWFWRKNKLGAAAQSGDIKAVTRKINPGMKGFDQRDNLNDKYLAEGTSNKSNVASIGSVNRQPTVTASAVSPSVTMPMSPKIPTSPSIQESPGVVSPMGNGKDQWPLVVSLNEDSVGQNIRDRKLSHIVTGGLGSSY